MRIASRFVIGSLGLVAAALAWPAAATPVVYSNLAVNGQMATASRPSSSGAIEIESADDFVLTQTTSIDHATFIGLIPAGVALSSIAQVRLEIYRVFPKDSDATRVQRVPTRVNSPSDVAFAERDSAASELTFSTALLAASFTAANSVVNGINPSPGVFTGGEGPVTGQEVQIDVDLITPFLLPGDHYFFIPQVQLTDGNFLWLSASRPISGPDSTPFAPDLQEWIRNERLDPDWLRVGTDIVGGQTPPTFNAAFALNGTVPEPDVIALLMIGAAGCLVARRKARH